MRFRPRPRTPSLRPPQKRSAPQPEAVPLVESPTASHGHRRLAQNEARSDRRSPLPLPNHTPRPLGMRRVDLVSSRTSNYVVYLGKYGLPRSEEADLIRTLFLRATRRFLNRVRWFNSGRGHSSIHREFRPLLGFRITCSSLRLSAQARSRPLEKGADWSTDGALRKQKGYCWELAGSQVDSALA